VLLCHDVDDPLEDREDIVSYSRMRRYLEEIWDWQEKSTSFSKKVKKGQKNWYKSLFTRWSFVKRNMRYIPFADVRP
jgi:hypothetical protein